MGLGHPSSVLKWTSEVVETLTIKGACDLLGRATFFFLAGVIKESSFYSMVHLENA